MAANVPTNQQQEDRLGRVSAIFEDIAFVTILVSAVALIAAIVILLVAL